MKVLHIAAHLGGGVGKAHAALRETAATQAALLPGGASETHSYALLEAPRDVAFADRIAAAGASLYVTPSLDTLKILVRQADVVQVEWWNHPRLYALLAGTDLPAMRLALWVHISGLAPPLIPARLAELADAVLFTSPCSLEAPNLRPLVVADPARFDVVNSGFGFTGAPRPRRRTGPVRMGHLGTLDFIKLHPAVFDILDQVSDAADAPMVVPFHGHHDAQGPVAQAAAAMRSPGCVSFPGYAADPASVLRAMDVFLYLLAPGHYGTGENALIEAMSLGLAPVVWNNPAEAAIVANGRTGFVVASAAEAVACLGWIQRNPAEVARIGRAAACQMHRTRTPSASLDRLALAYARIMTARPRRRNFRAALGGDARAWFLSTLSVPAQTAPEAGARFLSSQAAKGSLGHFRACLPDDASLAQFSA